MAPRTVILLLCIKFKCKQLHGHFYFPPNVFFAQPSRTPLVSPLLNQPHARTNYYQSSFVPSTISAWNNLPHTALTAHTTQSFKAHIAPFFCNCFNSFNRVHTGISCTYSYYVSVALLLTLGAHARGLQYLLTLGAHAQRGLL